jgi:ElaB/YqjD/DUF883 family membrane-anchored ribosome-binding protein
MTDEDQMAEDEEAAVRGAAGKASDKVRELGDKATKAFRDTTDKASKATKESLNSARRFAETVPDTIAAADVREILTRQPWITMGVAFVIEFIAGQIVRRPAL